MTAEWQGFGVFPNAVAQQDGLVETLRRRGAEIVHYVPEWATEAILSFRWQGHEFRGDTMTGGSWTFEASAGCPRPLLEQVYQLLAEYLGTYEFSRRL